MAHTPSRNRPAIQVPIPTRITDSGSETRPTNSAHSSANQKVRICQLKCDSSQVPRTSLRFT